MGSCVSKTHTNTHDNNNNNNNNDKNVPEPKPLWETDPAQHEMNQFIQFYHGKRID